MERPLTSLIFVISGFALCILANLVESQRQNGVSFLVSPPPPPPSPPPPPPSPPPPSPPSPPPPSPPSPPPPSPSPPPPSPSPPPPSPSPPPPPPPHSPPPPSPAPPPPPQARAPPPPSRRRWNHHPPPKVNNSGRGTQGMNKGKKIGLIFVGIAAILQFCVVGFLVFKRRQLLSFKDNGYETYS